MIEGPKTLTVNRSFPRPTAQQIAGFQGVPTGFVADALGGGGSLAPYIRPLGEGRDLPTTVAGPALTAENGPGDVLATLAALNFVQPGDLLVVSVAGHQGASVAGDRVMGMLRNGGGRGLITDGPMRDYAGIKEVGLPVWSAGLNPASPFASGPGRIGFPMQIAGQQVASGDIIVADFDGVVVVPFARIDQTLEALVKIKEMEDALDQRVVNGLKAPENVVEMLSDDELTTYQD